MAAARIAATYDSFQIGRSDRGGTGWSPPLPRSGEPGAWATVVRGGVPRFPELLDEAGKRHVLGNHVMRDQGVAPRLAAITRCMVARVPAPFERGIALCQHVRVLHLVRGLGFQHQDAVIRLCHEVRLIFLKVGFRAIEKLKLAAGGLEPFLRVAIENESEPALGVRLEFLHGIEAPLEPAEQVSGHVRLVRRSKMEIERSFSGDRGIHLSFSSSDGASLK